MNTRTARARDTRSEIIVEALRFIQVTARIAGRSPLAIQRRSAMKREFHTQCLAKKKKEVAFEIFMHVTKTFGKHAWCLYFTTSLVNARNAVDVLFAAFEINVKRTIGDRRAHEH